MAIDYSKLAFVDTETTGLDADRHEIWEVGLIIGDCGYRWFLPVDLGRADPIALKIGRYHERHPRAYDSQLAMTDCASLSQFAEQFAWLTRGRHLVGAVVSFDEERLRRLLQRNGACPEWHYHLIDVEALAVGYLAGISDGMEDSHRALPWQSDGLTAASGVVVPKGDKHTALGDARWAKAIYEAVMG